MGIFSRFRNRIRTAAAVRMAQTSGDSYFAWNGKIYESDIVRACIAPKVKAIGKLLATHIREEVTEQGRKVTSRNPDAYMRFLLEEPNPYMTGQKLQERLAAQLALNGNAFALIVRDDMGLASAIYPIPAQSAEAVYDAGGNLFLRFSCSNNTRYTFPYADVIHLTEDVQGDSIFGTPKVKALVPLMQVITTTDQGIVNTIKNSAIIRWLLKFATATREDDIDRATKHFADSFLDIERGTGVAGIDSRAEAVQIHADQWTPNSEQTKLTTARIYALFNTNAKIVTSAFTETEWQSYFEAEIEPVLIDMQNEFTRKLFSRRQRGFGNRIVFDASGLNSETTQTKLSYVAMVNRKAMTPNEWRALFNLPPVDGGDELLYWQDGHE